MKKGLICLCSIFLLSFILHVTGVSADTEKYFAAIELKTWSRETFVESAIKTETGKQRLYISSYFNRNLKAKIVSTNGTYNGDTGYAYSLTINDGFNTFFLGNDPNSAATAYVFFTGNKSLYMKTSGTWLDGTNVSGQWNLTSPV